MSRLLVTVGTDGHTDWVKLPNGTKMSLGPISVLQFVTTLSLSKRTSRLALDRYLAGDAIMFMVDEDRLWELLAPRRARWASDGNGSFMAPDQHIHPTGKETMSVISKNLEALEQHVELLNKHASTVTPEQLAEGHKILAELVHKIEAGSEGTDVALPQSPEVSETLSAEGLAFDTVQANKALADEILTASEQTVTQIDKLVAAGKKFAADRAKADIYQVTSKVAGILSDAELTESWVSSDLKKLASKANHLRGLFLPTNQG